ncbi:MAK10-like protein, partial [Tanacetum coccineum]
MGDENPIHTLGDYSKPSHEGYRNTIELPKGNNVVPLRSDTIQLVQNGCSFHGLRSEDPNQLVDSLDLNGSISTWEDLTTRFLAQFFPPGRTAKLRNDILMFQQHQGESISEAWTRFKDLLQKVPHHGIDLWLQSAGGKLHDRNAKESWALLEDLAHYDNESWNDPWDLGKPVKAISLPQDVLSTSDYRLIELENQVQRLMEAHLAPKEHVQVNKISSSCEICSGPRDTQYCMENPEQAFVDYASLHIDEAGVLKAITDRIMGVLPSDTVKNLKLNVNPTTLVLSARSYQMENPQCSSQIHNSINAIRTCSNQHNENDQSKIKTLTVNKVRMTKSKEPKHTLEDKFKDLHLKLPVLEVLAHAPIYNAILDKYVESLELGENGFAFIQGKIPKRMEDPRLFTLPCRLRDSKPFDTLADLGSCVNIISLYLFKKLKIGLLEETEHVFGLADRTKSYPIRIVMDVELHIGRLKLLNDFYVIDMKKDLET